MKISSLLSITAATFAFAGSASAELYLPPSLETCLSSASDHQPSIDRCHNLDLCVNHSSSGEQSLQDCIANVEATYQTALAGGAPSSSQGVTTQGPIVTETSHSDYEDIQGHKGWGNAELGE